jgi:hypothetical protein
MSARSISIPAVGSSSAFSIHSRSFKPDFFGRKTNLNLPLSRSSNMRVNNRGMAGAPFSGVGEARWPDRGMAGGASRLRRRRLGRSRRLAVGIHARHGPQAPPCLAGRGVRRSAGGVQFINYLDYGNYLGMEREQGLIESGIREELGRGLMRIKSPQLVVSDTFEFEKFSRRPKFAIAQSLFTHLAEADIRLCLEKLRAFIDPGGRLYATYFIVDRDKTRLWRRSHSHRSFRYTREMVEDFGKASGWIPRYIGDWGHPRNQQMIEYVAK